MNFWSGVLTACLAATLAVESSACSSDEVKPPEFGSDAGAVANAKSCKEAREGQPSGNAVFVDGEAAACAGNGAVCSLADVAVFDGICAVGNASAVCTSNLWQIACTELDGSATSDASSADSSAD